MTELINKAGIRKRIQNNGLNTAGNAAARFDELLASIIDAACDRAKSNKRKTVMPQDI